MTGKYARLNNLQIYTRSLDLTLNVLEELNSNKGKLKYNYVKDQLSRSVASIGANIAEGFGRTYKKDFKRFLSIARGSCFESSYWFEIANNLRLIDNENRIKFEKEITELVKMITTFMKKLEI
ncbi:MAG TPA: four helix bundle protein [Patescibacteria group bacterium]|nr:four helix bundle protein [Patescibacteria group bacterium]